MEVSVKHESGFRFSRICRGYTVTAGHSEDGNVAGFVFQASIGMASVVMPP